MSGLHVSVAALLVAVGELLTAIGQKNSAAFYPASRPSWLAFCRPYWWLTPSPGPDVPSDSE